MIDPITGGLMLARFAVPKLVKWIAGDKGEAVANEVTEIASQITGESDIDKQLAALKANPEMLLEMQRRGDALEIRYLEENTKRLEMINETMRSETAADDKFVRRWRPMIGYVVAFQLAILGLAVFVVVIGSVIATFQGKPDVVQVLYEGLATLMAALTPVLTVELGILGVNIAQRSKDKQVKAGMNPGPGLFSALASRLARPKPEAQER